MRYNPTVRSARLTVVLSAIDQGLGAGTLELGTAGFALVLVIFTCNDPCGVVAGDALTFSGLTKTANAIATGAAVLARFKDSTGVVIADELTVGTAGTNIIISPSTSIVLGQPVNWVSGVINHPVT